MAVQQSNVRSSRRYDCRIEIEYGAGDDRRSSFTRNLSLGGASFPFALSGESLHPNP